MLAGLERRPPHRGRSLHGVKINAVFGGAPGGASEPRRASGSGLGFGPELLDEMTAMKVGRRREADERR